MESSTGGDMTKGLLITFSMALMTLVVAVLMRAEPDPGARQAPTGASSGPTETRRPTPNTPWGAPDLQGIWTDNYAIPLQRPLRYANKEFFTEEEQADLDRKRSASPRQNDNGIARRGTEQDVSGAYNSVFTSMKHTGRRTSLVVDPVDGRIPPVTVQVEERRAEFRAF